MTAYTIGPVSGAIATADAPPQPVRSLRQGTHTYALRRARTCYNHLAGRLGVVLMAALLRDGVLVGAHRPGPAATGSLHPAATSPTG